MKLLRKTRVKITENGNKIRYGIFWCDACKQEVEKQISNGLKQKSCGCVTSELISEAKKGIKYTEDRNKKISKTRIEKGLSKGKNHPMFGKHQTEEARQKISKSNIGKKAWNKGLVGFNAGDTNPMYGKKGEKSPMFGKYGQGNPNFGSKRTEITRQKMKENHADQKGENNPNWNNGSSFEPYGLGFNKELKQSILERDNYTCQYPNCTEVHDRLHVHHIDFNKKNNSPENLITLGHSCHMKTNGKNNREHWTEFYQSIMMNRIMECLL